MKGQKGGFNTMLKQAQKLQGRMSKLQDELANRTVDAQVGGGLVKIKINGSREIVEVVIAPEVVDPEDVASLQDLLTVAFNEAIKNIQDMIETETNQITGGVDMPWML